MIKFYCDICDKQIPYENSVHVLISESFYQEYDLCDVCNKAIVDAKNKAEIETVKELGRKKHE